MRKNAREFTLRFFYHYQLPEMAEAKDSLNLAEKISAFDETIEIQLDKNEKFFVQSIVEGVVNNYQAVEEKLKQYVTNQNMSRISKTDYSLLLLSIYELGWYKKTPKNVVITEALELSKKYGNPETLPLINALLDKYAKDELK